MGRARAGKDTVGATLCTRYMYTRVSFADPLREMALKIDPHVYAYEYISAEYESEIREVRLSKIVSEYGWEIAKDAHPEVRRILQNIGQTVREYDEDFWLRIALDKIAVARKWGLPVVVTDCRYPNEYEALRSAGFKMVRVYRPEPGELIDWKSVSGALGSGSTHESETALFGHPHDVSIRNNGTLAELRNAAEALARRT